MKVSLKVSETVHEMDTVMDIAMVGKMVLLLADWLDKSMEAQKDTPTVLMLEIEKEHKMAAKMVEWTEYLKEKKMEGGLELRKDDTSADLRAVELDFDLDTPWVISMVVLMDADTAGKLAADLVAWMVVYGVGELALSWVVMKVDSTVG